MSKQVMSKTKLAGNQQCKVLYHQEKDMVELEVGGISLKLAANNFFMINEMMRKAAAKLVMQTELKEDLHQAVVDVGEYAGGADFFAGDALRLNLQGMAAPFNH